jgi:hypothetical protein
MVKTQFMVVLAALIHNLQLGLGAGDGLEGGGEDGAFEGGEHDGNDEGDEVCTLVLVRLLLARLLQLAELPLRPVQLLLAAGVAVACIGGAREK